MLSEAPPRTRHIIFGIIMLAMSCMVLIAAGIVLACMMLS